MINLDVNVDIKLREIHYPLYFERKNICVACGANKALKFINIFGKEASKDIHPFQSIRCSNCGAVYSILWSRDDINGMFYPSAVDPSIKRDFVNLYKSTFTKKNLIKEMM